MRKVVFLLLVASLVLVAACGMSPQLDPSSYGAEQENMDIQMSVVENSVVSDAESVSLAISNESDKEYTYSAASTLEVKQDGAWYVVEPKETIMWIEIAFVIQPGEIKEENVTLNEFYGTLEPGSYRIVKSFNDSDGQSLVAFSAFTVE